MVYLVVGACNFGYAVTCQYVYVVSVLCVYGRVIMRMCLVAVSRICACMNVMVVFI